MKADFVENDDGVHIMNPVMGGEFTLCGDAFDIGSEGEDGLEHRSTSRRTVTCPNCAVIILACRGVRVEDAPRPQSWTPADDFGV